MIMKRNILKIAILGLLAGSASSCIEEYFPESSIVTADQVNNMSSGTSGLVNAMAGRFGKIGSISSEEFDLGYPGLGMIRDIHCEDFSIHAADYEYFWYYATNTFLNNNYVTIYFPWAYYYKLIASAHQILRLEFAEKNKADFGLAHFFRAWAYFDLARWYEFKNTGFPDIDEFAKTNNIYGLTVPIIDENTTEAEARNLPRVPFYEMYDFILNDLKKAEEYLTGYNRPAKNVPDVSTVYGLMARFYLELASRFDRYPDDLGKLASSGVDLGFSTAQECYTLAANYARKAISMSGAVPLSESDWYGGSNYTDGFNSINSQAWMLGIIIQKENLSSSDWRNFIGHMSPEQYWGVGGIYYNSSTGTYENMYGAQRIIGDKLYKAIDNNDWRKLTWVDPNDAGKASARSKYKTSVPDDFFAQIPAYASFKFRPKNGERIDYSIGAAADYPLMRVEEMYFIEAEALAGSQGLAAGINALESFINQYRYTNGSYRCAAADMESFRTALMLQKRIEFWGEGIVFWDYKRLELQIVKGYEGNNFPEEDYRLNSIKGYCAPWLIGYISTDEVIQNPAIILNPDCSDIPFWTGD